MADALLKPLVIEDLTGGFDDLNSPHQLEADQCTLARNIEFWNSTMGERRLGCAPVDLTGSGLEDETSLVFAVEWFPDGGTTLPEWFCVAATPGTSVSIARRDNTGTWHTITPLDDAVLTAAPAIYAIQACSINGKLFVAYPSTEDRMHVWDGTNLRRAGLEQPDAPTAASFSSGSGLQGIRYYRVRFVIHDASDNVLVRSEPSESVSVIPTGAEGSIRITRPVTYSDQAATHWELEASSDNVTFYRMQYTTVAITIQDDLTVTTNTAAIPLPSNVTIPPGYVQLSSHAIQAILSGEVPAGAYAPSATNFPVSGWAMYDVSGTFITQANLHSHNPPSLTDTALASQDIALLAEKAATDFTSYSDTGTLSDSIGQYLLQGNNKFLAGVDNRLVSGGHFSDVTKQSSVYWTPVHNDPLPGADERLPGDITNNQDLDNGLGGPVTGLSAGVNGSWYAFKYEHIYKANHNPNNVDRAYTIACITDKRGCVEGSLFSGLDQNGAACLFFTDPHIGPFMLGAGGMLQIMGLRNTWKRVNLKATNIVARGVYYHEKEQAIWYLAVDGNNTPNFGIKLQVGELRPKDAGSVYRGWATVEGRITEALCITLLSEAITVDSVTSLRKRPFIGLNAGDLLQRCDGEAVTDDANVAYSARVRTKAFFSAGLMSNWGTMCASAFVASVTGGTMAFFLIRDLGQETSAATVIDCDPANAPSTDANVDFLVVDMPDLVMSESRSIQIEFGDL